MGIFDDPRITPEQRATIGRFTSEVPVKVGALAAELGLKVTLGTLKPGISGEIRPDGTGGYTIRINRHERKERQRFTLAHEIGHFLLHRDRIGSGILDDVMYRSGLSDPIEAEANRAAAEMLMPRRVVLDRLRGTARDEETAERLARMFEVSVPAMKIRIGV